MKKLVLLISLSILFNVIHAQTVPIGAWQEHLSYRNAISVAEGGGKVYCATTSGVFVLNKSDRSVERLSRVNGLSDVEPAVLNFNPYNNKLLLAYKNSNIDLISQNIIVNISDIKRKTIVGKKDINNIFFLNQYAYLACGFGIVVIDTDRDEVKDTYYIGNEGAAINVRDVTFDNLYIYAATDNGVYRALKNAKDLASYTAWSRVEDLPIAVYNTIAAFNGKVYTNCSVNAFHQDTIFVYSIDSGWTRFSQPLGYTVKKLRVVKNKLLQLEDGSVRLYDQSMNLISFLYGYFNTYLSPEEVTVDDANHLWVADARYGLVENVSWGGANYSYYPNGPVNSKVVNMSIADGKLWTASGGFNSYQAALYIFEGIDTYTNDSWSNLKNSKSSAVKLDTIHDITNVLIDPKDSRRAYATTWGQGLLEFYDNIPVKVYNETNSSLVKISKAPLILTYGLAMDANNNLWISSTWVNSPLSVKKANGSWKAIDFSQLKDENGGRIEMDGVSIGQILIDDYDQKWMLLLRTGALWVYKGNTTDPAVYKENTLGVKMYDDKNQLVSFTTNCMAKDLDGEIWLGTNKGIMVVYSPENLFTSGDINGSQILIEQDGNIEKLLERESVQCFAVDDANRKWIGTANAGVFLMSADGTKQIYHFDEANSPLFSNDVKAIEINRETGEVYFATSKGIISYRGTSTIGAEDYSSVYAFPNPVKPEYEGPIVIKGLMSNSNVKITDISGSLVYETESEGGQALWYGRNLKNEKVSSGVYMVFCTSEEGEKKTVTKIVFVN